MNLNLNEKIGGMKFSGLFNSKSFFGYSLDILKSGLQKYVRRREYEKMMWCLVELDKFSLLGDSSKSVRSNLKNRIIVMCFEELCFSEWDKLIMIKRKLDKWENEGRKERRLLVEIMDILIKSKLLRINSDIKNYFGVGIRKYNLGKDMIDFNVEESDVKKYIKKGDDKYVLECLGKFVNCLDKKDDNMFYWMFEICNKSIEGVKGGIRYRRKGCEYIIWDVLYNYCDNELLKECLDFGIREFFKKDRKERMIFLIECILLVKNKDKLDWNKEKVNIESEIKDEYINEIYDVEKRKDIVFDDYVIDLHCKVGRIKGKDKVDFMKEGCKIINEDKEFYVEEYRKGYNSIKIWDNEEDKKRKRKSKSKKRKIKYDYNERYNKGYSDGFLCKEKVSEDEGYIEGYNDGKKEKSDIDKKLEEKILIKN